MPVITITTEAFIDGAAQVVHSASIDVDATANSTITTTSSSTPLGASAPPNTLATLNVATPSGQQTDGAAVAATTFTVNTRAFITTTGPVVSSGTISLLSTSNHNVSTTADATPSVTATPNNAFAVATNVTFVTDEAFVGGNLSITAPTLDIATGGTRNFKVVSKSGAAGLGTVNQGVNAGAVALSTGGNVSDAYIASGANLTLTGGTDVVIHRRKHDGDRPHRRAGRRRLDRQLRRRPLGCHERDVQHDAAQSRAAP